MQHVQGVVGKSMNFAKVSTASVKTSHRGVVLQGRQHAVTKASPKLKPPSAGLVQTQQLALRIDQVYYSLVLASSTCLTEGGRGYAR